MKILYVKIVQWLLNRRLPVPAIVLYFFDKIAWSSKKLLELAIIGIDPVVLERMGEKKLIWTFQHSVRGTPALQKFYHNKIDINGIRSIHDFTNKVPITTKENYIYEYSLNQRCCGGELPKTGIIFKSAGVAGERTYWTQSVKEEDRFSVFVPFGLEYLYQYSKKNYHLLNCWAFGTWPTAIDFTKAARDCGRMINIGPNTNELIQTIKKLGNENKYLISGYPPFLRNMLFEGKREGIKWKDYSIDVLTGGEGFVEEWRELLTRELGEKSIIISAYGSTDKGLGEGIETPLTITARNLLRIFQAKTVSDDEASKLANTRFNTKISIPSIEDVRAFFKELFKQNLDVDFRIPMIFQSDPLTYFHEEIYIDNSQKTRREVVTTNLKTYSSQPVIRYNIGDESGIISFHKLIEGFLKLGIDIIKLSHEIPHGSDTTLPYPFFFVYGRTSGAVSIDGVNIFPEEIGRVIEHLPFGDAINSFRLCVTDNFRLGIDLECKQSTKLEHSISIVDEISKEFREFSPGYKTIYDEGLPSSKLQINFFPYGSGPFERSPSVNPNIVKYQYVGSKILGHH